MKSTLAKGVKQNLKWMANQPWEGASLTACLLENEPTSYPVWQVKAAIAGATATASLNRAIVARGRPETR